MPAEDTIGLSGGKRVLVVEWHECAWQPTVQQRCGTEQLMLLPHPARRQTQFKLLKKKSSNLRRFEAGFTLVELLTVIAIIAILAAMLLVVLTKARQTTLVVFARHVSNNTPVRRASAKPSNHSCWPTCSTKRSLSSRWKAAS